MEELIAPFLLLRHLQKNTQVERCSERCLVRALFFGPKVDHIKPRKNPYFKLFFRFLVSVLREVEISGGPISLRF